MKKRSVKKDSVVINVDKLEELMQGKSLRDYERDLGESAGVTYKTLQRMKRGDKVNEVFAQAIADHHGISLDDILLEDNSNPDFSILSKIKFVNNLFEKGNFKFFRRRQLTKSLSINKKYFYKCPIDEDTSESIKGFLDSIMGNKSESMFIVNKTLEEEFNYLDAIANANKFIKQLAQQNIHIFYGTYLNRFIGSANALIPNENREKSSGDKNDEEVSHYWPCLYPSTQYNEIFVFKHIPSEIECDKIKIFPNTGYDSFDELKKDYLKILKIDLLKFRKKQKYISKIIDETSEWLEYQENEKNWDVNIRKEGDNDFNMHKQLPFTHLIKHDEDYVKKLQFTQRDMGLDVLRGAKVLVRKDQKESLKIKKVKKEKEDAMK